MKKPRVQVYLGLLTSQFIQFSIILLSSITRQLDFISKSFKSLVYSNLSCNLLLLNLNLRQDNRQYTIINTCCDMLLLYIIR